MADPQVPGPQPASRLAALQAARPQAEAYEKPHRCVFAVTSSSGGEAAHRRKFQPPQPGSKVGSQRWRGGGASTPWSGLLQVRHRQPPRARRRPSRLISLTGPATQACRRPELPRAPPGPDRTISGRRTPTSVRRMAAGLRGGVLLSECRGAWRRSRDSAQDQRCVAHGAGSTAQTSAQLCSTELAAVMQRILSDMRVFKPLDRVALRTVSSQVAGPWRAETSFVPAGRGSPTFLLSFTVGIARMVTVAATG